MAKREPISVIVYYPKTEEGKQSLREQVAWAHAQVVGQRISKCKSAKDRQRLMDAILSSSR